MKNDTQHLEFLISQYVDGTLDASSRKTMELQLLNDPVARDLYKEQQETQDLLDDWGNRLPLINWTEFDNKLAARLEQEVPAQTMKISPWRKWIKPAAIAASLFLAVGTGYVFRAMQNGNQIAGGTTPPVASRPTLIVSYPDRPEAQFGAGKIGVDYSSNLATKAGESTNKWSIGADPVEQIKMVQRENDRWPFDSRFTFGPETQPRAVQASETTNRTDPDGIQ